VLKLPLKDAYARAPLLVLILLDAQPFSRSAARQFANDYVHWVKDEGFAIFNVPGGACAQILLRCWGNQFSGYLQKVGWR